MCEACDRTPCALAGLDLPEPRDSIRARQDARAARFAMGEGREVLPRDAGDFPSMDAAA